MKSDFQLQMHVNKTISLNFADIATFAINKKKKFKIKNNIKIKRNELPGIYSRNQENPDY